MPEFHRSRSRWAVSGGLGAYRLHQLIHHIPSSNAQCSHIYTRHVNVTNTTVPSLSQRPASLPHISHNATLACLYVTSYSHVDLHRCNHLISICGFVHKVLQRSRTSTGILQTALCYLAPPEPKYLSYYTRRSCHRTSPSRSYWEVSHLTWRRSC